MLRAACKTGAICAMRIKPQASDIRNVAYTNEFGESKRSRLGLFMPILKAVYTAAEAREQMG
jgi:hypothetical protein